MTRDASKPSLSEAVRAWAGEERSRLGERHPGDDELRRYLEGGLEEERRREIETQIVLDPDISERVLRLSDALEDERGSDDQEARDTAEKRKQWRSIEQAL
ncbi:MAG: hypothetical protein MI919_22895, partial [Holophagales bacterium]|nr:hypothetical protein [Holophagales bacterium]